MKIDFSQKINNLDGSVFEDNEGPLTLARVASAALNMPSETGSLERGMLAIKVWDAGKIEITPEEATLIRTALPKAWVPVVVARAHEMLGG